MQEDLLELEEDFGREYFSKMYFDIYEDLKTGVTFAVPQGAEVEFTKDLFTINVNGMVFMFIPFISNSYENTKIVINEFSKQVLAPYPNAQIIPGMDDEIEDDIEEEEYNHVNIRSINVDGKRVMIAVGGEAEENIGAGMVVVTESLLGEMNQKEVYTFMQLVTAIELVSFSKH